MKIATFHSLEKWKVHMKDEIHGCVLNQSGCGLDQNGRGLNGCGLSCTLTLYDQFPWSLF